MHFKWASTYVCMNVCMHMQPLKCPTLRWNPHPPLSRQMEREQCFALFLFLTISVSTSLIIIDMSTLLSRVVHWSLQQRSGGIGGKEGDWLVRREKVIMRCERLLFQAAF